MGAASRARKTLRRVASHALAFAAGAALGIYALPILTAPSAPSIEEIASLRNQALYTGQFRRNLRDSDLLHWGEGTVSIGKNSITLVGRLAPGPDYKLYLSPEFVESEAEFARVRPRMVRVNDVRTFGNFIVAVPDSIDVAAYNTVIVWCETFGQFITAAQYR